LDPLVLDPAVILAQSSPMTATRTAPIAPDWPTIGDASAATATAADVTARLAGIDVCGIDTTRLSSLAAAAAELASVAGIPWRFSLDDPAVALVRLITKVAIAHPDASGPHTARLLAQLT
jgi:hypothetical protein